MHRKLPDDYVIRVLSPQPQQTENTIFPILGRELRIRLTGRHEDHVLTNRRGEQRIRKWCPDYRNNAPLTRGGVSSFPFIYAAPGESIPFFSAPFTS